MSQVSPELRRTATGYSYWCPACEEMHVIPDKRWSFNGDLEHATFIPSVKITGVQQVIERGEWTGEWVRGTDGRPLPMCCHYNLTNGVLIYHGDCLHALSGQKVPLPDIPEFLRDERAGS